MSRAPFTIEFSTAAARNFWREVIRRSRRDWEIFARRGNLGDQEVTNMGQSRIEITATGNHGCDRDAKEGETLKRCDAKHCVDCRTLDFVDQLQRDGAITFNEGAIPPEGATLTHWPSNADGGIVDDLVTGKRKKNAFR